MKVTDTKSGAESMKQLSLFCEKPGCTTKPHKSAAYTSIAYMSTTFPCTTNAIHLMQGALLQGSTPQGLPATFAWYDVNGNGVVMTLAQLQASANLFFAQVNSAFQQWQTLNAQVKAATTIAAVQAIVWTTTTSA